ncbi:hypothetical protein HOY82DRAFT_595541 [Tuber indicum]|nr:hypothetical protein HOY82DRAFT_595541 [Tuber indicum]
MHAKYGSRKQDGAPRRVDTKDHILEHGIGEDRVTNLQTFRILDAFSSLSVHKPKAQVVAFALQADSPKQAITLTIAENKNVQAGLDTYVKEIWEGLRKLSIEYGSSEPKGSDEDRKAFNVPHEIGLALKVELYRTITQHTLPKQLKRVEAFMEPLLKFMEELIMYRGDTYPQGFDENLGTFVQGMVQIASFLKDLQNGRVPTDEEWELMFLTSKTVSDEAAVLLSAGDHVGCENLAQELNLSTDHHEECPFRLRRAIEKLISQSGHIENLFEFANSPNLRRALQGRLAIYMVPDQSCLAKLPKSSEEWESILVSMNFGDPDDRRSAAERLAEYNTKTCPVHCECKIVQHFMTGQENQRDAIPPFNYLGVSKLSCGACRVWLEAHNELCGQQFYTRGSHGAWYWPWGMPTVGAPLEEAMVAKVRRAYAEHQVLDARTESTVASATHEISPRLTTEFVLVY